MSEQEKRPIKRGWGWPTNSKKAHYFFDGRSLCGKWGFFGDVDDADGSSKGALPHLANALAIAVGETKPEVL
jgi:hypothetical protein